MVTKHPGLGLAGYSEWPGVFQGISRAGWILSHEWCSVHVRHYWVLVGKTRHLQGFKDAGFDIPKRALLQIHLDCTQGPRSANWSTPREICHEHGNVPSCKLKHPRDMGTSNWNILKLSFLIFFRFTFPYHREWNCYPGYPMFRWGFLQWPGLFRGPTISWGHPAVWALVTHGFVKKRDDLPIYGMWIVKMIIKNGGYRRNWYKNMVVSIQDNDDRPLDLRVFPTFFPDNPVGDGSPDWS